MAKNSSLVMQNNIKNNSEELKDFLNDLNNWEKDIKIVDTQLAGQAKEEKTDVSSIICLYCVFIVKSVIQNLYPLSLQTDMFQLYLLHFTQISLKLGVISDAKSTIFCPLNNVS